jgi:hypothetical protein
MDGFGRGEIETLEGKFGFGTFDEGDVSTSVGTMTKGCDKTC